MLALNVIAKIQPGKEKDFITAFKNFALHVQQEEPGTLVYQLNQSQSDPGTFLVYERYKSQEDLDAHGSSEKFKEFSEGIKGIIAGKPERTVYTPIV